MAKHISAPAARNAGVILGGNMRSNANFLKSIGLTNAQSEDFGTFVNSVAPIKTATAYCTSDKCCSENSERFTSKIQKEVSKHTICCPDCRSVLLWKKEYRKK